MENNQGQNNEDQNHQDFKVTGNWDSQSKQLKSQFSQLTDSDLKFESGQENEMLGRVETRLNKKRNEVIDILRKNQEEKA